MVKPRRRPPYEIILILTNRKTGTERVITLVSFTDKNLPRSFHELSKAFWDNWNQYRLEYGWYHAY